MTSVTTKRQTVGLDEAAFHRRLRKCSLSVLRDELVRRRLLRKNGDAWELTPKGKKELVEAQSEGDRPAS